jgi:CheY-like chemotaxis protein
VLIVDDEPNVRASVRRMLRKEHDVVEASSGLEAQKIVAETTSFDVILCDLMMPELSGMEFHEWLVRAHPALAQRVVFITGGVFTPRARTYLAEVDNLRMEKPFEIGEFRQLVRDAVASSKRRP